MMDWLGPGKLCHFGHIFFMIISIPTKLYTTNQKIQFILTFNADSG